VMTAIIVGVGYLSFSSMQRPAHYFLVGFREFLDSHADLPEIRRWFHSRHFESDDIPPAEWPREIAELSPSHVFVWAEGDTLVLFWAGAYFNWGVVLQDDAESPAYSADLVQQIDERTYVFALNR